MPASVRAAARGVVSSSSSSSSTPRARRSSARSARELVAHLGYWDGHAADALHAAEEGRTAEFDAESLDVEARNATVARVAAVSDFETASSREEASFDALLDRLRDADPAWLYSDILVGIVPERGLNNGQPSGHANWIAAAAPAPGR